LKLIFIMMSFTTTKIFFTRVVSVAVVLNV